MALRLAHDELERKIDERTRDLARAHEQIQAVYDGMVDGLIVSEIATRGFLLTNKAMLRMTGYDEEELLSLGVEGGKRVEEPAVHRHGEDEQRRCSSARHYGADTPCRSLRHPGPLGYP